MPRYVQQLLRERADSRQMGNKAILASKNWLLTKSPKTGCYTDNCPSHFSGSQGSLGCLASWCICERANTVWLHVGNECAAAISSSKRAGEVGKHGAGKPRNQHMPCTT